MPPLWNQRTPPAKIAFQSKSPGLSSAPASFAAVVEDDGRAHAVAAVAVDGRHVGAVDAVVLEALVERLARPWRARARRSGRRSGSRPSRWRCRCSCRSSRPGWPRTLNSPPLTWISQWVALRNGMIPGSSRWTSAPKLTKSSAPSLRSRGLRLRRPPPSRPLRRIPYARLRRPGSQARTHSATFSPVKPNCSASFLAGRRGAEPVHPAEQHGPPEPSPSPAGRPPRRPTTLAVGGTICFRYGLGWAAKQLPDGMTPPAPQRRPGAVLRAADATCTSEPVAISIAGPRLSDFRSARRPPRAKPRRRALGGRAPAQLLAGEDEHRRSLRCARARRPRHRRLVAVGRTEQRHVRDRAQRGRAARPAGGSGRLRRGR